MARWESPLLPGWEWEAYDKIEEDLYLGRVKSPHTHGKWEYGPFSQSQLETAAAYRTDTQNEEAPLYPDGGKTEELAELYETELTALLDYDRDE